MVYIIIYPWATVYICLYVIEVELGRGPVIGKDYP